MSDDVRTVEEADLEGRCSVIAELERRRVPMESGGGLLCDLRERRTAIVPILPVQSGIQSHPTRLIPPWCPSISNWFPHLPKAILFFTVTMIIKYHMCFIRLKKVWYVLCYYLPFLSVEVNHWFHCTLKRISVTLIFFFIIVFASMIIRGRNLKPGILQFTICKMLQNVTFFLRGHQDYVSDVYIVLHEYYT